MTKESKKLLWIGIVVVIILGGGLLAWNGMQTPSVVVADPKLLMNANSHSNEEGTRIYPVTLVEFGDYQCPACGFAAAVLDKILKDDPRVKLVFRNFPLSMHQYAPMAAEAAEAANAQGKFWEMHDVIYLNQQLWSESEKPFDVIVEMAKKINMPDIEKFKADITANKYAAVIEKDRQDGLALNVNSTPTFYVNGKKYQGSLSYVDLKAAIDEAAKEGTPQK